MRLAPGSKQPEPYAGTTKTSDHITVSDYVRLLKMENELYKRLERFQTEDRLIQKNQQPHTQTKSCTS